MAEHTTDKELEDLMLNMQKSIVPIPEDSDGPKSDVPNDSLRFVDSLLSKRNSMGRTEDQMPVWNNDMVFLLIDQYKLFKTILDDKQHAKKPVWERIAQNLVSMGCQVTPTQCSQKWRNMMLQRRQKRQRQLLGMISTKAVVQPWEEALEEVAPPVDMEQIAQMALPQGAMYNPDSPRMTQYLKRKRTEEAIIKSLSDSPGLSDRSRGGSPTGSSDPDEPTGAKQSRVFDSSPFVRIKEEISSSRDAEKFDRILGIVEEIRNQQMQFQNEQQERLRLLAERDERKVQLLQQFLALFAQATRMFLTFDQSI